MVKIPKKLNIVKIKNKQYCKKYNLVNQNEWYKMSFDEKLKIIKDMDLIKFLDKD